MTLRLGKVLWKRLADTGGWSAKFHLESPLHITFLELWEAIQNDEEDADKAREFLISQRIAIFGEIISIARIDPGKAHGQNGWFRISVNIL